MTTCSILRLLFFLALLRASECKGKDVVDDSKKASAGADDREEDGKKHSVEGKGKKAAAAVDDREEDSKEHSAEANGKHADETARLQTSNTQAPMHWNVTSDSVQIPDGTFPLLLVLDFAFPELPKKWKKFLRDKANITVNYSYYYKPITKEAGYTKTLPNALALQNRTALSTPLTEKVKPTNFPDLCWNFLCTVAIVCSVGWCYQKSAMSERPPSWTLPKDSIADMSKPPADDFHNGICGCCETFSLCCFSCCCPSIRIADTLSALGIMDFWTTIGIYLGISAAAQFIEFELQAWYNLMGLFMALFFCLKRHEIRKKLGYKGDASPLMMIKDFLSWWCCYPCCVVTQEAREVDAAQDREYSCFCTLRPKKYDLVGGPVATS